MKEAGTTSWNSPNTDATNTSLFTGLPGGYRYSDGRDGNVGGNGYWWSSTEGSTSSAWFRYLYYYYGDAYRYLNDKDYGMSVRCLRD